MTRLSELFKQNENVDKEILEELGIWTLPKAVSNLSKKKDLWNRLDQIELQTLIKALVIYCPWGQGSVTPVFYLWKIFCERFPNDEPDLTRWIVLHRSSEYEPFGTQIHYGATTKDEYVYLREADIEANRIRVEEIKTEEARTIKTYFLRRLGGALWRGDAKALYFLMTNKYAFLKNHLPKNEMETINIELKKLKQPIHRSEETKQRFEKIIFQ